MADSEDSAIQLDFNQLKESDFGSPEEQREKIKTLMEELREELILNNSLTQIVAEKSSEIEYLQNKIGDQESKIRNLEDQIEEWTTQSEACDKVLEQKDCEIEMLKKTLSIEKQQRRDLEEMMMEVGKENIKEREVLEEKIKELQNDIAKIMDEKTNEKLHSENLEKPAKTDDQEISIQKDTVKVGISSEKEVHEKDSKKEGVNLNEEYKADMEVLMNDMFLLIKQNEELKEEIEKVKKEQVNILEDKRSVVLELESTIEEKAAEIQHQKHEIRRLSSSIELGDVSFNIDKYNQVKQIRDEFESKVQNLEDTNFELQESLNENVAAKEALSRQHLKMKKKLQMEREQNMELNKQILEVSNLYDTYYSRCEELEKGRIKGVSAPLGDSLGDSLAPKFEIGDENLSKDSSFVLNPQDMKPSSVKPKRGEPHAEEINRTQKEGSAETQKISSSDDVNATSGQEDGRKRSASRKKRNKMKKQKSVETCVEYSTPRISDSLLNFGVYMFKVLVLVTATFVIITALRVHYGLPFENIFAAVFASYVFIYNLWLIIWPRRETAYDQNKLKYSQAVEKTILTAMQDLIMRLDDDNFKQFSAIYEKYIVQTFANGNVDQKRDLRDEINFLSGTKNVLEKELAKCKMQNQAILKDYELMKAEIEKLRARRTAEAEEKDKLIQSLKGEVDSLELRLKGEDKKEDNANVATKARGFANLKMLALVMLECLFISSVGSSLVLIPVSMLLLALLLLIYRSDLHLSRVVTEAQGYQRTVEDLLRKVDGYKKEERQISKEVKELETLVEKDYEIISKQRDAIERLERQLNRAINKYTEKKRRLGKIIWLQEKGVANYSGLDSSDFGDLSGNSVSDPNDSHSKGVKRNVESRCLEKCISVLAKASIIFILMLTASVTFYNYKDRIGVDKIPSYTYGMMAAVALIFLLFKSLIGKYLCNQKEKRKLQLEELLEDKDLLRGQVQALRGILTIDREMATKLEQKIDALKEPFSQRSISKEEVNSVIDRLIEVSKQRDELKVQASSTKDKYDHVIRTLEDILSREKYLSEEVCTLRSQKRGLQNDLMKEQIKQIDMYEEIKKLKENSQKEVDSSEKSTGKPEEDDIWDIDYVDEDLLNESKISEAANAPENEYLIESDVLLDSLQEVGLRAQKNRTKRRGKKLNKKAMHTETKREAVDLTIENSESDQRLYQDGEDWSESKEMVQIVEKKDGEETNAETVTEHKQQGKSIKSEESTELAGREDVDPRADIIDKVDAGATVHGDADATADGREDANANNKSIAGDAGTTIHGDADATADGRDDANATNKSIAGDSDALLRKLDRQDDLLKAQEDELRQLKELVDITNFNRPDRLAGKSKESEYLEQKLRLEHNNVTEIEEIVQELRSEIFRFNDVCENRVSVATIEEAAIMPSLSSLIEHVALFRYKISAEKTEKVSKINNLERHVDEMQKQIEKLYTDIEKEKKARNHVIMEYENEYERLETRLSEAYEDIRKRLMEERALRGDIMKQYEIEIEDIQAKTTKILQDLHAQLKHERKEKDEGHNKIETLIEKIKELELETKLLEENGNNLYFKSLLDSENSGNVEDSKMLSERDVKKLRQFAEEEANKRTKILKEKLDQMTRSMEDYKNKVAEKDNVIVRLEKQELAYKTKIGIQDKRIKDLENEVRNGGMEEEEHLYPEVENRLPNSKQGIIYQLATKNGASEWKNPASVGIVQVSRSSAGFGSASDILDLRPKPCSTENLENSWFQLDFGPEISVIPESYSLCHGWISSDACLRSWILEGSVDGNQWHIFRKHIMDTILNDRYMEASWKLQEICMPSRYLRIRMTGPNASNTNELYIAGFEIYGKIVHSS